MDRTALPQDCGKGSGVAAESVFVAILGRDLEVNCHYMGQHREETTLTDEKSLLEDRHTHTKSLQLIIRCLQKETSKAKDSQDVK